MSKTFLTLPAFLLFAIVAHADDAPPAAAQAPQAAPAVAPAASAPKLICHQETPLGSMMSHKVCRTQEQVDADARNAEDVRRRIQYEAGAAGQQGMTKGY
jgi:hypothetical protein